MHKQRKINEIWRLSEWKGSLYLCALALTFHASNSQFHVAHIEAWNTASSCRLTNVTFGWLQHTYLGQRHDNLDIDYLPLPNDRFIFSVTQMTNGNVSPHLRFDTHRFEKMDCRARQNVLHSRTICYILYLALLKRHRDELEDIHQTKKIVLCLKPVCS